eukprot:5995049-Amphidinium_carterae.1
MEQQVRSLRAHITWTTCTMVHWALKSATKTKNARPLKVRLMMHVAPLWCLSTSSVALNRDVACEISALFGDLANLKKKLMEALGEAAC